MQFAGTWQPVVFLVIFSALRVCITAPASELVSNDAEPVIISEPDNSDLHTNTKLIISPASALAVWVFGYGKSNGPSIWYQSYSACGGVHQSPINLDTTSSTMVHHPHLYWWNYQLKPQSMTVSNNGHTVLVKGKWEKLTDVPYYWHSTGQQDEENYVFEQLHFHWGSNDSIGSEHTVNSQRYPLEMHVVHFRRKYSNMTVALSAAEGIRVVAILFMLSEHENVALRPIVSALKHIRGPSTNAKIEPFELRKIVPYFSNHFLTYNGSLTSPPCAETVSWVVKLQPSTVSKDQMAEFRKLTGGNNEPLSDNYRPIQPLNGRNVWHIR